MKNPKVLAECVIFPNDESLGHYDTVSPRSFTVWLLVRCNTWRIPTGRIKRMLVKRIGPCNWKKIKLHRDLGKPND